MSFTDKFKIRIIMSLAVVLSLAVLCMGRVGVVSTDKTVMAALNNSVSVQLESGRGDFLDCNGKKITGSKLKYINVFLPTDSGKSAFVKYAGEGENSVGKKSFLNNKPAVLERDFKIEDDDVFCFEVKDRYGEIFSLEHLLGYTNSENVGVAGLEKSFNDLLSQGGGKTVSFYVDAKGNYLPGAEPIVSQDSSENAVYLTIDRDIQKICSDAMADIKKGAVVVSEVKSGKIRAMVSKPGYDTENIADYLTDDDSPFLNRALCCYSVGSVFKPLIAAAMIENDYEDFCYECTGVCNISGIAFHCNEINGHKKMDLSKAITYSCNSYFYNAVGLLNPSSLTSLATSLMFNTRISIAPGIYSNVGTVPSAASLTNAAAAANFSIGQGSLLISPLSICNLYSSIANDGCYYSPTLIEGIKEDGMYKKAETGDKNIVMSKGTAACLKEQLSYVVKFGTGTNALPETGGAAGKTATAQTGKYSGNSEIKNAWFCGFFPEAESQYTVTVFLENSSSGGKDSAPIFKKIADGINCLKK